MIHGVRIDFGTMSYILDASPLHTQAAQDGEASNNNGNYKDHAQRGIVSLHDCRVVLSWDDFEETDDTTSLNLLSGDTDARDATNSGGQLLVKDILADRDKDGAK